MLDPSHLDLFKNGDVTGEDNIPVDGDFEFDEERDRHLVTNGKSGSTPKGRYKEGRSKQRSEDRPKHKGRRFLREVQDELEEQREEWKDTIDKLTAGVTVANAEVTGEVRKDTIIDESSGKPVFKAYFDVHEYPKSGLSVTLDRLQDKVIVQAKHGVGSTVARSFTQKVKLPRYADIDRMRSNLSADGILVVEVPLMFYFPKDQNTPIKSFVNQVKTARDGSKYLEIIVNTDEYRPSDLRVQIVDDTNLVIMGGRKRIKQYKLPENADLNNITSRLTNHGKLAVLVPMMPTPVSSPDVTLNN